LVPADALAEDSAAPSTQPATAAEAPYRVTLPAGFSRIEVGGRTVVCEPADEAWVRELFPKIAPATQPSTLPSDLLEQLEARRNELAELVCADLGISDPAPFQKFLDDRIIPQLKEFQKLSVPVLYLVTTNDRLKALLKEGWTDPHFRYNRVADEVAYAPTINLTTGREQDEFLVPVVFQDTPTEEQRAEFATNIVRETERGIITSIANRAQLVTQLGFLEFVGEQTIKPLAQPRDQEWFGIGVCALLSARYMSRVNGIELDDLLTGMSQEHPRALFRADTIDLSNPTDPRDLRQQFVQAYGDAYRRKSIRVLWKWLEEAPPDALPRTLQALRERKPASNAEMLKIIQEISGIDLSESIKAR
jgi:hypothetical protein